MTTLEKIYRLKEAIRLIESVLTTGEWFSLSRVREDLETLIGNLQKDLRGRP